MARNGAPVPNGWTLLLILLVVVLAIQGFMNRNKKPKPAKRAPAVEIPTPPPDNPVLPAMNNREKTDHPTKPEIPQRPPMYRRAPPSGMSTTV